MWWFCGCSTGESPFELMTEADHPRYNRQKDNSNICRQRHIVEKLFDKRFTQKGDLNIHKISDSREQLYSCSQCEKSFTAPYYLRKHMVAHSSKYKCSECSKCCRSDIELTRHRRSHSGEKPFECHVCKKRFALAGNLDVHCRIHSGEKPYKCQMCDRAFSVSGDLKKHTRVHTGDRPYMCFLCEKSFSQLGHLRSHKRHVHSNRRPYQCPFCGTLFKTNDDLKRHESMHADTKPHSCRRCSESFTWYSQLKSHLLELHNEGTWLVCSICQKKFSRRSNFKKHVRRHEGVKPYVCSDCTKRFCEAYELKQHYLMHSVIKLFCMRWSFQVQFFYCFVHHHCWTVVLLQTCGTEVLFATSQNAQFSMLTLWPFSQISPSPQGPTLKSIYTVSQ